MTKTQSPPPQKKISKSIHGKSKGSLFVLPILVPQDFLLELPPMEMIRKLEKKRSGQESICDQNSKKNRILIPIDTSQESDFQADWKYIVFIKFPIQKLRAWEYLPYFREKRETPPKSQRILPAYQGALPGR